MPASSASPAPIVDIDGGRVEGRRTADGIAVFTGIPYAAPPVGDRRWRPPQPVEPWDGVRPAHRFGPRAMQPRLFGDMIFRSEGMSEDCLYLNVWTPTGAPDAECPVLVYLYGGGFQAGDGSEPRYDGTPMARAGIVTVTLNYRLGVFGFLGHPALANESPDDATGNYGLLDQQQALRWVQRNIRSFGGDPARVTLAGESAGAMSVSAHLAAPGSKGLFAQAVGQSGALLANRALPDRTHAERVGTRLARQVGAGALSDLRAFSSSRLLEHAAAHEAPRFRPVVDGRFLPRSPSTVYAEGEQAHVPLLVGWNSMESRARDLLGERPPTPEAYAEVVREQFGDRAEQLLSLYPAATEAEVREAAAALAGDQFMGLSTWAWSEWHRRTGAPVYRYYYTHPRPPMTEGAGNYGPGLADGDPPAHEPRGAVHAAEIEYVLGTLDVNDVYDWTSTDRAVATLFQGYVAAFVKTGTPNGEDRPHWPAAGPDGPAVLLDISEAPEARPERHRARYRAQVDGAVAPNADE